MRLRWLIENYKLIAKINQPLLIIHGDSDRVIPAWHGRKLYDLALTPKFFYNVPGAGHNNIFPSAGDSYLTKIDEFVNFCEKYKK
ncbi:MAG: alpha/beta hydrolase [Victivallaceae bacterium]